MAASARYLFAWCIVALLVVGTTFAQDEDDDEEGEVSTAGEGINCEDGIIIPIWRGHEQMGMGDRFGRGVLYIALMIYLFIGVAIASDKFMESIESITLRYTHQRHPNPTPG